MSASAFVGRFPMSMMGLALTLLVVAETGSYATAGAVVAASTLSGAVGGPLGARLADRVGQHRAIPPLVGAHILTVAALTAAVLAGTPTALWLALAALAGLTGPNLGAMVRSRWAGVAQDPQELSSAFAFESMLDEVAFVLGPPLATALAVGIAPSSAIAAGLLMTASGSLTLAALRRTQPAPTARAGRAGPPIWRSGALRTLTLLMALMGAVFGAVEVATVAFAQERAVVPATGLLLGSFALGSGLTGLYLGTRTGGNWRLSSQILVGGVILASATALMPTIDGPRAFALGIFTAGLGVSAVLIGVLQIIERAMPRARLTESLAVAISGIQVGFAGAAAAAGALIDTGGSAFGLTLAAAAAVAGAALAGLARRRLAQAEALPEPTVQPGGSEDDRPGAVTDAAT
ncbi:MAG: MFS transporter, partial [Candidatus Nanopelagicales bacterium]